MKVLNSLLFTLLSFLDATTPITTEDATNFAETAAVVNIPNISCAEGGAKVYECNGTLPQLNNDLNSTDVSADINSALRELKNTSILCTILWSWTL